MFFISERAQRMGGDACRGDVLRRLAGLHALHGALHITAEFKHAEQINRTKIFTRRGHARRFILHPNCLAHDFRDCWVWLRQSDSGLSDYRRFSGAPHQQQKQEEPRYHLGTRCAAPSCLRRLFMFVVVSIPSLRVSSTTRSVLSRHLSN